MLNFAYRSILPAYHNLQIIIEFVTHYQQCALSIYNTKSFMFLLSLCGAIWSITLSQIKQNKIIFNLPANKTLFTSFSNYCYSDNLICRLQKAIMLPKVICVEIKVNIRPCTYVTKYTKLKYPKSITLLSLSSTIAKIIKLSE